MRVIPRAAIATREIEVPIGAEEETPAVMIPVRARELQEDALGRKIDGIRILTGVL